MCEEQADAGAPATQLINTSGFVTGMASKNNPITKEGGNEQYQFGLANYSMPWEDWSNATMASWLDFQGFGWVTSNAPWKADRMNCSYNNGIQDCMGSCIVNEMEPVGEQALRTLAAMVQAAGKRALMYFHAEISSETNAAEKYADAVVTTPKGEQIFYACDKYYGLFLPNETNTYGKELMKSIDLAFELGFSGIYHDEAGVTSSAYTYHMWDNISAILDPTTKAIIRTPGSMALLRRKEKLQILDTVVHTHDGVLLMNGPPITRTFREAAIRVGAGRVVAECEDEQENFMLGTHLFTPLGLTKEGGSTYNFDIDFRYNRTNKACLNTSTATADHCMPRSINDKLDYGNLPFLIGRMWVNGTAEPITQRMFPIEIKRIGNGYVQGVGKLVTKRSGLWDVGSTHVQLSIYKLGSLIARNSRATLTKTLQLDLGQDEIAIVEDAKASPAPAPGPNPGPPPHPPAPAPASVILMTELGAYDISTSETTPLVWYGDLLIVETIAGSARTIWMPGDPCQTGVPCSVRGSYFRIRKQALLGHGSNDVIVGTVPGSKYKAYAAAYIDWDANNRPTMWVFGTSDCVGWNVPTGCKFNTSAPGNPWEPCQCPLGAVARGEVWAMWSSDPLLSLSSWQYKKILSLPPQIAICNTDVTRGHNGQHVMVLEQIVYWNGGQGYRNIFAQTTSSDLSAGWELMNTTTYQYSGGAGRTSLLGYVYGDPTIRYLQSDGYYYIVPATWDKQGRPPVPPGIYPCCAVQWVARSKDLASWVDSLANPIMGWPGPHNGPGPHNTSIPPVIHGTGDTTVMTGSVLDLFGTAADKEMCANKTDDINRSDGDWVELPPSFTAQLGLIGPAVYVVWACGDQGRGGLYSPDFGCAGIVNATQDQWLQSYFAAPAPPPTPPPPPPTPATPIRMTELGAYDVSTSETTPLIWYGDLLIVEKIGGTAHTIWMPGDPCQTGVPCSVRGSYFRIRKQALLGHGSNDVIVGTVPGSKYKSFAAAYIDWDANNRPTMWVFGTSDCVGWNAPTGCKFNTSAPGNPWEPCQCPLGAVARGEVWAMWSSDPLLSLSSWQYKKILSLPPHIGVCNTDVTRGHNGQHVMVLEQLVYMDGGQGYVNIFAQTVSADLSLGWELMNTTTYQYSGGAGRTALLGYDYGDPTIRYLQSDGYYYIVPATWDKQGRSAPVAPGIYPCCAVQWIARSKDLASWVDSTSNPIMGWPGPHHGPGPYNTSVKPLIQGVGDTTVTPGSVLDLFGTAADKEMCANKTDDINRSDGDWVELPPSFTAQLGLAGPAVYVVWLCGDQGYGGPYSPGFGCAGIVNATQDQWLQSFFL